MFIIYLTRNKQQNRSIIEDVFVIMIQTNTCVRPTRCVVSKPCCVVCQVESKQFFTASGN